MTEADDGRSKLEWGSLRHRSGDRVKDLLRWDSDRLLGFLGIYGFDSAPELARRGVHLKPRVEKKINPSADDSPATDA